MAVKLVIESSSDIDSKQAEKLGITMLSIPITFDNENFSDGVDITPGEFYDKLVSSTNLPKTSQITAFRFEEAFEAHINNGDEVVAIVLSSKLSATCNSAKQAAEKFNGKVYVVDSLSATAGIKILVEYALRLIDEGKSAKEIFKMLEEKKQKVQIRAMVDTLKYLKKGGRISPLLAFAGELMGIKPLVSVIDGKVEVVGKAMGLKKAIEQIDKDIVKVGGIDFDMPFYVIYSGNDTTKAENYISTHKDMWECDIKDVRLNCIGATIGTHIGPGAIGIIFFSK